MYGILPNYYRQYRFAVSAITVLQPWFYIARSLSFISDVVSRQINRINVFALGVDWGLVIGAWVGSDILSGR
eukprot:3356491-Amphidinium_carterae.1